MLERGQFFIGAFLLYHFCFPDLLAVDSLKYGDILAFALQSANSNLRELYMSKNTLGDCGRKLFSEALNPHCKVETLGVELGD